MAKRSEAELRKAKDSAISAVTEQQRKLGVPSPGGRVVEQFVEPILRKMAQEEPVAKKKDPAPEIHRPGDDVVAQQVGTYDWNLRTDEITAAPGSHTPTAVDRMHVIVQKLMQLPEWRAQVLAARAICDKHQIGGIMKGCALCERRESAINGVLVRAYQKYGNPWRKREGKIIVSR